MDDRTNDLKTEYEYHIPEQEAWREGPWFSGMHILRGQAESILGRFAGCETCRRRRVKCGNERPICRKCINTGRHCQGNDRPHIRVAATPEHTGKKSSTPHSPDSAYKHRPSTNGIVEDCDMDGSGYNGSAHPPELPRQTSRRQPTPPLTSYGSSSASSFSTLMTPRDPHSWVSSAHSPSFMETSDSIPTSSPYQLHLLPSAKFTKDTSFRDFPANREFKFPSIAMNNSPGSPESEWFLDDSTHAMTLSVSSYRNHVEPKQPKRTRMLRNHQQELKQTKKAPRGTSLPGLGIISQDGSYNEGFTLPSKSRARHGPLTPEQRYGAALMRRHGACMDCRKRKVRCNIRHRIGSTGSPSTTPPPQYASLSFSSTALAMIVLQRCISRRYMKQMILPDISDLPISEQISRQASCFENMNLQDFGSQSLLRSQEATESSEANSINSFEDDLTEYSHEDSTLYSAGQVPNAGAEEFLAAIQPLLDQLPIVIASSLGNELLSLFGIWLGNRATYRQAPCDDTPSSSNSQRPPENTPTNSTGSVPKRLSDDGSGFSNPSGESGDGKRKRPRNVSQTPSGSTKKWACPYYQRDPHSYCVVGDFGDYRKCSKSPGFSEVHRVKQHLYDCHAAIYCTRCYSQFKRKEDLVDHRRSAVPCGLRDPQPLQGLNEEQREFLKPRDRNKSEEERWKTVYKICFPTDKIIPSPYYVHYTQETALLRRQVLQIVEEETMFVDGTIRERLLRRLQNAFESNTQTSGPSQSLIWSSGVLDLSDRDGTYMPSTVPPISNPPPWSEWETRHTNPQSIGHNNGMQHHPLPMGDDTRLTGPSLESVFFLPEISSFEYNFGTGEGNDMTDLNDTE